jgi:hypothetical protein
MAHTPPTSLQVEIGSALLKSNGRDLEDKAANIESELPGITTG